MSHPAAVSYAMIVGGSVLGVAGWLLPAPFLLKNKQIVIALPLAMIAALIALIILSFPVGMVVDGWHHLRDGGLNLGDLGQIAEVSLDMTQLGVVLIAVRAIWIGVVRLWSLWGSVNG